MKRLSQPTGEVVKSADNAGDTVDKIVRSAILVHAGPNGQKVVFQSADGEIVFDEARIKRIVENQNKGIDALATQYGGFDKIPTGAFPPILDQHADDSNNRVVGRLTGKLRFEPRSVPKVGENVPCAVSEITFLGKETVERVHDGRIYHLSIGINETSDTLGEVSTVIDPAAPGAMLLNRSVADRINLKKGVKTMSKAQIDRVKASAKRMATLSRMNDDLKKMSTDLRTTNETVRLTRKEAEVSGRITKLMSGGKLTPAESKKIDIKRLAKLDKESLETIMSSYEIREPVITPGQRGTSTAVEFADLAKGMKKKQIKNLKSEVLKDMSKLAGKKITMKSDDHDDDDQDHGGKHEMGGGNREEEIKTPHDEHSIPESEGDSTLKAEFHKHMHEMKRCMEEGDHKGAMEHHAKAMAHLEEHGDKHLSAPGMGDTQSEDYKKGMGALESRVDELSTQLARMAGMVSELMDTEKEEGHDLEAEEKPEKQKLKEEIENH